MTKVYNHFDSILNEAFDRLNASPYLDVGKYPPYNIVRADEETTVLEFAVAGFSPEDLTVEVEDNMLRVKGQVLVESEEENPATINYIHRGISRRAFTRKFALHQYMEVADTTLSNGILSITIKMVIPENKKPRKVDINVV